MHNMIDVHQLTTGCIGMLDRRGLRHSAVQCPGCCPCSLCRC
jgi:hypothetical protein